MRSVCATDVRKRECSIGRRHICLIHHRQIDNLNVDHQQGRLERRLLGLVARSAPSRDGPHQTEHDEQQGKPISFPCLAPQTELAGKTTRRD
jgi:hypothetical protein